MATLLRCVSMNSQGCRTGWEEPGKPPGSFQEKVLGQGQAQLGSGLEMLGEELL